jgi:hypothetical protein
VLFNLTFLCEIKKTKVCAELTGIPRGVRFPVFDSNPFEPVTFFQQQKISNQKMPPLVKFLTAKNGLFLGRFECIPSRFTQMASLPFVPRTSHFLLKL